MVKPIIGFCEGYLHVFPTKEDAEIYIEPIDVENGEWEIFDSVGQVLKLEVVAVRHQGLVSTRVKESVIVSDSQPPIFQKQPLQSRLVRILSAIPDERRQKIGVPRSDAILAKVELPELVEFAIRAKTVHSA